MAAKSKRTSTPTKTTKKTVRAPRPRASSKAPSSKLERVIAALRAPRGATISDLMDLTGWQAHSVRGAISGALKRERGLNVVSDKPGEERVYRIQTTK